jgi:hypothetical protein
MRKQKKKEKMACEEWEGMRMRIEKKTRDSEWEEMGWKRWEIPGGLNPGSGSLGPVLEFITYTSINRIIHSLNYYLTRTDSGVKRNDGDWIVSLNWKRFFFMNEWLKEFRAYLHVFGPRQQLLSGCKVGNCSSFARIQASLYFIQ